MHGSGFSCGPLIWKFKHKSVVCCLVNSTCSYVASFPGLPRLRLQAIKNWSRGRPGNEAIVMSFLFMFHVCCLHIPNYSTFLAVRTGTIRDNSSEKSLHWVTKSARTTFGKGGPMLAAKIGPGNYFWVGPIFT